MATTASHGEQLTVHVSDRVPPGTADDAVAKLRDRPSLDLLSHYPSPATIQYTVAGGVILLLVATENRVQPLDGS